MGGLCSKQNSAPINRFSGGEKQKQVTSSNSNSKKIVLTPPVVQETIEKGIDVEVKKESPNLLSNQFVNGNDEEFYDGIPRYRKHLSLKSRSLKVSEVSARLSRAGSVGLGRAVDVLDTLGSSVTNLNVTSGFVSGATNKNNELSIVAFEVANTIVKGSNLMQSLSKRSIRQLKEVVLSTESVKQLISEDMDDLMRIVAADKREELKIFAAEVIRFGNRCKDPQWHNLHHFFEKRSRDRSSQKQLRDVAEAVMLQLMNSVQLTAELYQAMHTLDKFGEDYLKHLEELKYNTARRGDRDNSMNVLNSKIKNQKKLVKNLKKKSLWSTSMEDVMDKVVDIVLFLNQEIANTFGNLAETETTDEESLSNQQKLGPTGLALHYANIIVQIDSIVAREGPMLPSSRDSLYQSLPPNMKASLRSKIHSFHVEMELTVPEIKDEMEKTLQWLVPVATNTAKAHHGFGWVGEWASTGSDMNRRTAIPVDVMQIETLHHADKHKTDAYIIDLLLWLNYLVSQSKASSTRGVIKRPVHSPENDATSTKRNLSPENEIDLNCKSQEEEVLSSKGHGEQVDQHQSGYNFVDLGIGNDESF